MTSGNWELFLPLPSELMVKRRGTNGAEGGHPVVYPDETVRRALLLMQETRSVAGAMHILERELPVEQMPDYNTLWGWAKQHDDVVGRLEGPEKRNMVILASDVASEASSRMIQALAGLSDSQMPVAYGIAMQRRTDWDKVGQTGPQTAIQINITGPEGERLDQA